jgi:hypothetical protein
MKVTVTPFAEKRMLKKGALKGGIDVWKGSVKNGTDAERKACENKIRMNCWTNERREKENLERK